MRFVVLLVLLLMPAVPRAEPGTMCSSGKWSHVQCIRPAHFVHDTCQAIERFAGDFGLDPGFFARLIWQESRFDPNALSPANAMGIAQFIRSTADLRGLTDPFNPALALEHSAHYLAEMQRRFGNAGLAAVGYNGGERRAEGLIDGSGGLARETVDYVQIITGLSAETWRDAPPRAHDFRLQKDKPFRQACHELARHRRLTKYPPPVPPRPKYKPWGVQLAFGTSEGAAKRAFAAKSASCRGGVRGEKVDYIYVRNRVSGRKGYFMARIGRDDVRSANALCRRLRSQGCVCAVYENN